jgi:hypothetical protein
MVVHALGEALVTECEAAELLGLPLMDVHAWRNMEPARAAADQ